MAYNGVCSMERKNLSAQVKDRELAGTSQQLTLKVSRLYSLVSSNRGCVSHWSNNLFFTQSHLVSQNFINIIPYSGFFSLVLNFVLFVLLRLRTNIFHKNNLYAQ